MNGRLPSRRTPVLAMMMGLSVLPLIAQDGLIPLRVEGGSKDDQRIAWAALGVEHGKGLPASERGVAMQALQATDRFRSAQWSADGQALFLESWPPLSRFRIQGQPRGFSKELFPGLRKGLRLGPIQIEQFRSHAQAWLREGGFPLAEVKAVRTQTDSELDFIIEAGRPNRIERVKVEGQWGPYSAAKLEKLLKVRPGKSLWCSELRREALGRIRQTFIGDRRYLGQAELQYEDGGLLRLKVNVGPEVSLEVQGKGLRKSQIKRLVPLDRADRYSSELLEEGVRRIQRLLRAKGYLSAKVRHEEVQIGDNLKITYFLEPGERHRLKALRFESNEALDQDGLSEASGLNSLRLQLAHTFRRPHVTPELLGMVEDRIKASYLAKGYTDVALRRQPMVYEGSDATLTYEVREGRRHMLKGAELVFADHPGLNASRLSTALLWLFADHPVQDEKTGLYLSDRASMEGVKAQLVELPLEGGKRRFQLLLDKRVPLIRHDLALLLGGLRDQAAEQGFLRVFPRLNFERRPEGPFAVIQVDELNQAIARRLVVQGASRTRSEAIFRALPFKPQQAMTPSALSDAHANLGSLGAFNRIELFDMKELPKADVPGAAEWQEGDLMLKVGEQPNWSFSTGFGYDSSQGYHLDLGAQRVNLGGMGRSLDFGIRAGDATLNSPFLRKIFSSDTFTRSVDIYRVAYRDPWFAPDFLESVLPDRTQLDAEGAYLEERRTLYLIRRRRFTTGLEWPFWQDYFFQVGYRFERSDVKADKASNLTDDNLEYLAKIKRRTVVSAPFIQIVKDRRDNPYDPTKGVYGVLRLEFANQLFGTGKNTSFVKMDLRHQWNWAIGERASWGVVSLFLRGGAMVPTGPESEILPLSERFFAGGSGSHRGVEPDFLGPVLDLSNTPILSGSAPGTSTSQVTGLKFLPIGGQALALASLEYRFPVYSLLWGEVFVDSGQVYERLRYRSTIKAPFPPFRTSLGLGLMVKFGIPIKAEFAWDVKRLQGKPRSQEERDTQLQNISFTAGFQF